MSRERVRVLARSTIVSTHRKGNKKLKAKLQYCSTVLRIGRWRGKHRSVTHRKNMYEMHEDEIRKRWCWLHDVYLSL